MKRILGVFWMIASGVGWAQISYPYVLLDAADPTGNSCAAAPQIQTVYSTGNLYTCKNGTMALAGGGGGSGHSNQRCAYRKRDAILCNSRHCGYYQREPQCGFPTPDAISKLCSGWSDYRGGCRANMPHSCRCGYPLFYPFRGEYYRHYGSDCKCGEFYRLCCTGGKGWVLSPFLLPHGD